MTFCMYCGTPQQDPYFLKVKSTTVEENTRWLIQVEGKKYASLNEKHFKLLKKNSQVKCKTF